MKIGVDAREIQNGVVTGIGRSLANFIKYFGDHEKHHVLFLFSEKSISVSFKGLIELVVIKKRFNTFFWDQFLLPSALKSHQIDLFYSPYYKAPIMTRKPYINQVLDLMYLDFPKYRNALGVIGLIYYYTLGRVFSKKAINIITDSAHAKEVIIRFWKIYPKKITKIPLGIAERYSKVRDKNLLRQAKDRWLLPDRFLLYLGNFKPHKNIESLILAFDKIKNRFPDYKLVLAGPLDVHGKIIKKIVKKEKLEEKVIFTDTIREEDNPEALLTLAELFVFPSLYEGFGIPPLEAMACGTPVITSNLTAIPETVGEAAIKINPLDIDEMSQAMIKLLENSDLRKEYSQKGLARADMFTEEKTAGEIYRHIIDLLEVIK